jgi:acetolactate synthase I/II/III large subunit
VEPAGLNDGFIKQNMPYVCYHNEQGAGHAAIGESKFTGKLAVVNPTTGCAGTNCATSVLDAWQDSVPVLFISGNVRLNTCSGYINQFQEV